jgi:hypothetical protein
MNAVDYQASTATWAPFPSDDLTKHDPTATSHQGTSADGEWTFLVVSYAVSTEGLSRVPLRGMRGYDGTATCASRGLVMRLPRELAERCYKLATKGDKP